MADPKSGPCPCFKAGDTFLLKRTPEQDDFYHLMNGKFCGEAWDAISRYVYAALDILEKEKNISKSTLLEAIEQSLLQACKNHFGKAGNAAGMTVIAIEDDYSKDMRQEKIELAEYFINDYEDLAL